VVNVKRATARPYRECLALILLEATRGKGAHRRRAVRFHGSRPLLQAAFSQGYPATADLDLDPHLDRDFSELLGFRPLDALLLP
jgi:hypothetical protein